MTTINFENRKYTFVRMNTKEREGFWVNDRNVRVAEVDAFPLTKFARNSKLSEAHNFRRFPIVPESKPAPVASTNKNKPTKVYGNVNTFTFSL